MDTARAWEWENARFRQSTGRARVRGVHDRIRASTSSRLSVRTPASPTRRRVRRHRASLAIPREDARSRAPGDDARAVVRRRCVRERRARTRTRARVFPHHRYASSITHRARRVVTHRRRHHPSSTTSRATPHRSGAFTFVPSHRAHTHRSCSSPPRERRLRRVRCVANGSRASSASTPASSASSRSSSASSSSGRKEVVV